MDTYSSVIRILSRFGSVLTEHVGDNSLSEKGESGPDDSEIYKRDIGWLKEADIIVADVTIPSLGVGYEIGKAEDMGKRILCIRKKDPTKRLSGMISGNKALAIMEYDSPDDLETLFERVLRDK